MSSEYEIVVDTGTKPRSGTTANVFLTMYGKNGASPKLKLSNKKDEDTFSKGKKDTFHHVVDDLGPIVRCRYADELINALIAQIVNCTLTSLLFCHCFLTKYEF